MTTNTVKSFHAYVINLDKGKERREHMSKMLKTSDIEYTIIPAVLGADLKFPMPEFSEKSYQLMQGRRRIDAEVGCYLSHMKALELFSKSDYEYGLILEDDARFSANLKQFMIEAISYGNYWDMLRLSVVNSGRFHPVQRINKDFSFGVAMTREKGAAAYLVSKKAAKIMLDRYLPMRLPYDHRFDLEFLDGMKVLGITPLPVEQRTGFDTQIQNDIRSYYLPKTRYFTVFPCRVYWETRRFFTRLARYLFLSVIKMKKTST